MQSARNVFCLVLASLVLGWVLVTPATGQTLTRAQNPLPGDCGLPSHGFFNVDATVTTFNMTSDCLFSEGSSDGYLHFAAGDFTINGNGFTITVPADSVGLFAAGTRDPDNIQESAHYVTLRGKANASRAALMARGGGVVYANNVTFVGTRNAVVVLQDSRVYLENVTFLQNSASAPYGSAITLSDTVDDVFIPGT